MVETTDPEREVTGGIDTHADTHTVAALDDLGRLLGHATFAATSHGYEQLLNWLSSHGGAVALGDRVAWLNDRPPWFRWPGPAHRTPPVAGGVPVRRCDVVVAASEVLHEGVADRKDPC